MNCFQSIGAVTTRPSASSSNRSDRFDVEHAFFTEILLSLDLGFSSGRLQRRLRQFQLSDKRSKLGDEGYAVFLREDFNRINIAYTAVAISIMIAAIVQLLAGQGSHVIELVTILHIALIFGHNIVTTRLRTSWSLRPRKLSRIEVISIGSWIAYNLGNFYFRRSGHSSNKYVFQKCLQICIFIMVAMERAPEWSEEHNRLSLDWKEIRLPFLDQNKGPKQP